MESESAVMNRKDGKWRTRGEGYEGTIWVNDTLG